MIRPIRPLIASVLVLALAPLASAQKLSVTSDHADGVYDVGQTVSWSITWDGDPAGVEYTLRKGGLTEIAKGGLALTDGAATVTAPIAEPGTLLLEVRGTKTGGGKPIRVLSGAIAGSAKIAPSAPIPDDFDAFWDARLKDLSAIPANPVLTPGESKREGVSYWQITMDNINASHIRGQIARPTAGEKFPAILIVQWAGVYGLDKSWVTDRAADGWLALNILAHDLPIDQPQSFYKDQDGGALRNYPSIGNDDRMTSYFLRMYLSCYRAAEYLTQREDWNGQTLVVTGGSQGGLQTFVTAALHPKVTAAIANVPAGCDVLGPAIGRQCGWPMWYWQTGGKDEAKVREAGRYYDVVNFAHRINSPMLVGIGLIDETCPPAGIYAAIGQVRGPVEAILLPKGAHGEENGSHRAYNERCWGAWLPALKQGKPAPISPAQ
jgi:cephalosporin-C deacetylase-like acetyl esterase